MAEPQPSFNPRPSKPRLALPRGACDTHFHVFGPAQKFPFAPDRTYTPADAPQEALFAMHAQMGIERGVMVQSAAHGFDNSAGADLIAAKPSAYVGVALVPVTAPFRQIQALDRQGFRGVRFNYMPHLGEAPPIEDVLKLAHGLAAFDWHLQIHLESSLIAGMAPALKRSPVPVMIDHMMSLQVALIVAGGVAYTVGIPILLLRRPDPWPTKFGYHEIWHGCTVLAAALHFGAVALLVTNA